MALDSKTQRAALTRGKKHQESMATGRYLIYRRGNSAAAGTWSCKYRDPDTGKYAERVVGIADDVLASDGVNIFTYDQARAAAGGVIKRLAQAAEEAVTGEASHSGPITVEYAWKSYLDHAKGRGVVGIKIMEQTYDAQIGPELGMLRLSRLTDTKISSWHRDLAEKGKRKTGKKREEVEHMRPPEGEDEIRQRRDTANRILSTLKAALNFAYHKGWSESAPWQKVKPFPNTASKRVRNLSDVEQRKLVEACDQDFQALVLGALFTGARYGELVLVLVQDFDVQNGTLYLAFGKGKGGTKARQVTLTKEGAEWFETFTKGRSTGELMFQRNGVQRKSRTLGDPGQWASYDQVFAMQQACKRSGVSPVTFHELRHTYASRMLNQGVALSYVARQLGHVDLRMVTRYYGHIAEKAMIKAIRSTPRIGLIPSG